MRKLIFCFLCVVCQCLFYSTDLYTLLTYFAVEHLHREGREKKTLMVMEAHRKAHGEDCKF